MVYKILADIIVITHFLVILFMFLGFFLTLKGFFNSKFFDKWLFRTLHLFGMVYIGLLAVLRQYCPLTIMENTLRARYNPELTYPGSFIVYYIEKLVYPDINPVMIIIPTTTLAVFTLVVFIIRPPKRLKRLLSLKYEIE